ncbi:MAG TPA: hypothetical protein VFA32_02920 [Dehalococcoidia bacterium]|jgi:hypothetical protein|nr:hypothetical protein [Dehalococcoidia bacterium]
MNNSTGADKLLEARSEAADVLPDLMRSPDTPVQTRLEAARVILDKGELTHRMSQLEQSMKETNERVKWSLPG